MGNFGYLHEIKGSVILGYARDYKCEFFVETGTLYGEMIAYMLAQGNFSKLYSIELSPDFYRKAVTTFSGHPEVVLLNGDSGKMIKEVLPLLKGPALFWLDAHYSGGATVRGDRETPILEELTAILAAPARGHVIIIDDLQQFVFNPAYPRIDTLRQFVEIRCPEAQFDVLDHPGAIVIRLPDSRVDGDNGREILPASSNLPDQNPG